MTYLYKKARQAYRGPVLFLIGMLAALAAPAALAQTPYSLAAGSYLESFDAISSWTNDFAAGTGASHFGKAYPQPTLPNTNNVFTTGTAGGVQKGTLDNANKIVLLATGTTNGANAAAFDLYLDFSSTRAGTISLDWSQVSNSTGDRRSTFRLQTNTGSNGTFVDLPHPEVVVINQVPATGSLVQIPLPAAFDNNPGARIRFFLVTSAGGTTGSRPKISLDNIQVTATPADGTLRAIHTTALDQSAFCLSASAGSASFPVAYTASGTFTGTFKVQLSDAAGVFAANTSDNIIGTGTGTSPIMAAIPANTPAGTAYRLRVLNDGPATYGPDNGADLSVTVAPQANPVAVSPANSQTVMITGTGATLAASPAAPSTFSWRYGTSAAGPFSQVLAGQTAATYQVQGADFRAAGTYYIVVQATTLCGQVSGQSAPVALTVTAPVPTITATPAAMADFGPVTVGAATAPKSFTVAGADLNGDIIITPPAGCEIRTGTGAFACCPVVLPAVDGAVAPATIEVRLALTGTGAYQAALQVSSAGAPGQAIAVSGRGEAPVYPPTISTSPISSIGTTSVQTGGTVESDGGLAISEKGVVWSTAAQPTLSAARVVAAGDAAFAAGISGLRPGTTYFVRAYATNAAATAYGEEFSFTTVAVPLAAEPTAPATLQAAQVGSTTLQLNFAGGDGAKKLVLARQGSAGDALPVDATTYAANATFGQGDQVGAGSYVVYAGTGTSVTVTDLQPNTAYHFTLVAYNDNDTPYAENYLAAAPVSLVQATAPAPAQLLLEEHFDYPAGALLADNNWSAHSGTSQPLKVIAPGLEHPGYGGASAGNAAAIVRSGEDVNRPFAPIFPRTPVYAAFLVKVNNATSAGDYFFHLGPANLGSTFRGRVAVKKNTATNKIQFGISGSGSTTRYTTDEFELNTTYLLVLKYTFDETGNETSLFVNPGSDTEEPATPEVSTREAGTTSAANIGTVALRQGSSSPDLVIDGIRVGNTYRVVKTGLTCLPPSPAFTAATTCAGTATTFADASAGVAAEARYAWDVDSDGQVDYTTREAVTHTYPAAGTYTATLTISQGTCTETFTQQVSVVPVARQQAIAGAASQPVNQGQTSYAIAETGAATFSWHLSGGGTIAGGQGTGAVQVNWGNTPGLYTLSVTYGNGLPCSQQTSRLTVAVYDDQGGFVTGGGQVDSPRNPSLPFMQAAGKAQFSLQVRYLPKGQVEGHTHFDFKAGQMQFKSSAHDPMRLVVAGNTANYTGKGTINGTGQYGFLLAAAAGRPEADKLRMQIWDLATGAVVYDNQAGAAETAEAAATISSGAITIHMPGDAAGEGQLARGKTNSGGDTVVLSAYPNPFQEQTTIQVRLDQDDTYAVEVLDTHGRLVEQLQAGSAAAGELVQVTWPGAPASGTYIIRLRTGQQGLRHLRVVRN